MIRRGKKLEEIINKRFGLLIVKELIFVDISKGKRRRKAKCLCDCGNVKNIFISDLENGDTKSCGCLKDKSISERSSKKITNQRFGKLVALKDVGSNKGRRIWLCKCDCGNFTEVLTYRLTSGTTKSCGCYQKCKGKEHWNWKDEISNEDRLNKRGTVKNPKYEEWRKSVFIRDNYKCKLTCKNGNLVAHHLDGWNLFPNKRYEISNGITLLQEIHRQFHKLYQNGNNTVNQFIEFTKKHYGIDFNTLKL